MESSLAQDWIALGPDQGGDGVTLQSSRTSERLNQIDRVRANGIGDHIALPQLVVCGDQSAGKSSVLEGITGIPFPRQDGLCTRFATEIILRHAPGEMRTSVAIIPHASRTEDERKILAGFRQDLPNFADLPSVIDQVATLMGVRGFSPFVDAPAFAADVLRIELVGNTGLHLTIVDLPGLIEVSEVEEDVELVRELVDSYLENARTIILAVVPASSDVDTQGIIQRARRFDPDGVRTVGVITKPDLINAGTEHRVARLAKNNDRTRLTLGFFLLKNPTPAQLEQRISPQERRRLEQEFFTGEPWQSHGIDPARIGIDHLRTFLQELLDSHIERELPKVRQDVQRLLAEVNKKLTDYGIERSSPNQIRLYLTRISTDLSYLVKAGLDGSYDHQKDFFQVGSEMPSQYLRAKVHTINEKFATFMREHGQTRKVVSEFDISNGPNKHGQLLVSSTAMSEWIRNIYTRSRGMELPGNYNPALLGELFHTQSARWGAIAQKHVEDISARVYKFMDAVLEHVVKDSKVRTDVRRSITTKLEENLCNAKKELDRLLEDEARQPITYNHYFTDNVQRLRNDGCKQRLRKSIKAAVDEDWNGRFHFANNSDDMEKLIQGLQGRVVVNMVDQACSDAHTDLDAYYKVALKTFVDNVCRQVIERHLLSGLPSVFDPALVSTLSDTDLLKLAAESADARLHRSEALQLREALEQSLHDLNH